MPFHVLGHFCERSPGKENFVDAFALHLPGVVVRDRAAAPTENRDIVCPLLPQLANDVGKKIDVTAVVTGNADRSLMKRGTYCGVEDTGPIAGETFEQKVARLAKVSAAAKQRADGG